MTIVGKLLVLAVLGGVVLCAPAEEPQSKVTVEHEELDKEIIHKSLQELAKRSSIQFMEYGPDGEDGYKYHLAVEDDKEYIIHTLKPISIPIAETIASTREQKDRKLLERLIESGDIIKSMDTVRSAAPLKSNK